MPELPGSTAQGVQRGRRDVQRLGVLPHRLAFRRHVGRGFEGRGGTWRLRIDSIGVRIGRLRVVGVGIVRLERLRVVKLERLSRLGLIRLRLSRLRLSRLRLIRLRLD